MNTRLESTNSTPARKSRNLAHFLAQDRAFKGIGPRRAQKLEASFGGELRQALAYADERVVKIIGEEAALNAAAMLEMREAETDLFEWLDEIQADIPSGKAIKLARAWGTQGIKEIVANPYLLLAVSDWNTVDQIALAQGVPKHDDKREIAAIEASLTGIAGLGRGSTLVTIEDAFRSARKLLGYELGPDVVRKAVRAGAAIRVFGALQPPGAAQMEAECALRLSKLISQTTSTGITDPDALEILISNYGTAQEFQLTEAQKEAVRMSHRHRLSVLAGYAGSGKTTVLKGICQTQEAIGKTPLIVTLSGRAAQRAAETTQRRAITVARFLFEQKGTPQKLGADIALIVDEASMLGLVEMWQILRRLGKASLLLCGDPAQLPPVSPGVIFHSLAVEPIVPRVILDRVHRQDKKTGIPAMAEKVRNGEIPDLPAFNGVKQGVTFLRCSPESLCEKILQVGMEFSANGADRKDVQIIAPTNREIGEINEYFHDLVLRRTPVLWPKMEHIAEGEPVIWTQNDPTRGLTNGSLGRIKRISNSDIVAEIDGHLLHLKPEDGQYLQLAYAISVHKAQGSQWPSVLIPLFDSKIVDRSLIYTALTRAQEQVVFLGSVDAAMSAVKKRPTAELRSCGFDQWLELARQQSTTQA